MPRYKESERKRARKHTREKLLEAATDAFSRVGYERANVDDISKAAGFAKGTIYNYFESKQVILHTLIDEIAAAHNAHVRSAVERTTDPAARLESFLKAGFSWVGENSQKARLMFNTLNSPDADLRERIFADYGPMFQLLSQEILTAGIEEGRFRDLEAGPTSGLIMLFYLGAASQTDPQGKPWLPPEKASDLLLKGLLKR